MKNPNCADGSDSRDWITASEAVGKMVGWTESMKEYDGIYLWDDLQLLEGKAIGKRQLHDVLVRLVGEKSNNPELPIMTAAELVENDAAIARWNQMLRDSHRYMKDIAAEVVKGADGDLEYEGEWHVDGAGIKLYYPSVESWVRKKYGRSLAGPLALGVSSRSTVSAPVKPWSIVNPMDPPPLYGWYTPARHFARELVQSDPTLRTDRAALIVKLAARLDAKGIKKRGGKKSFNPETLRKALANVKLG
jgi:hypothetical protein